MCSYLDRTRNYKQNKKKEKKRREEEKRKKRKLIYSNLKREAKFLQIETPLHVPVFSLLIRPQM